MKLGISHPFAAQVLDMRTKTKGSDFDVAGDRGAFEACARRMEAACGPRAAALLHVVAIHHLSAGDISRVDGDAAKARACALEHDDLAACLAGPLAGTALHPNCAGDVAANPAKLRAVARRSAKASPSSGKKRPRPQKRRGGGFGRRTDL